MIRDIGLETFEAASMRELTTKIAMRMKELAAAYWIYELQHSLLYDGKMYYALVSMSLRKREE